MEEEATVQMQMVKKAKLEREIELMRQVVLFLKEERLLYASGLQRLQLAVGSVWHGEMLKYQ